MFLALGFVHRFLPIILGTADCFFCFVLIRLYPTCISTCSLSLYRMQRRLEEESELAVRPLLSSLRSISSGTPPFPPPSFPSDASF